jgi:hypothetical protein
VSSKRLNFYHLLKSTTLAHKGSGIAEVGVFLVPLLKRITNVELLPPAQ